MGSSQTWGTPGLSRPGGLTQALGSAQGGRLGSMQRDQGLLKVKDPDQGH